MPPFLQNIRGFLGRLTLAQRAMLGLLVVGGAALLVGVAYWTSQPDYALLFGNLDSTDANKVVEALREDEIAYDLREGGSAVYVPRASVYELRLRFASEGRVSKGQIGYELFDRGTLGMTDFMQKLNLKRALEGELSRTVASIRQVERARVHLVMPERSPFRDQQQRPSASVVVQRAGSAGLSQGQIAGMTALVAGAVEGMSSADVTVLDTDGTMLSDPDAGDTDLTLTSTQLDMQRSVEKHLAESGQSMLDEVLGPGNAIVRVSATLDFSRTVSERKLVDPESATVISEERLEEEGEATGTANSTVRNYDLSRTTERSEKSIGDVSYLTVSVILDQPEEADEQAGAPADGTVQTASFTGGDLAEIESLVKNAVGFKPERGDRFAIHQTRFDQSAEDEMVTALREQEQSERIERYIRYGLIVLALLAAAWLVRSTMRRLTTLGHNEPLWLEQTTDDDEDDLLQIGNGDDDEALPQEEQMQLVDDMYTSKLSEEAKRRLKAKHLMFEEIKKQADESPDETAALLRTWLAESPAPSSSRPAQAKQPA